MVTLLRALGPGQERCAGGILEHLANALTTLSGAFKVVLRTDLLSDGHALRTTKCHTSARASKRSGTATPISITNLLGSDGSLRGFPKLLNHPWFAPKILLAADKDDRQASAEVHDFRNPL